MIIFFSFFAVVVVVVGKLEMRFCLCKCWMQRENDLGKEKLTIDNFQTGVDLFQAPY